MRTDHSKQIEDLYEKDTIESKAAAALLEVHDATGISLDKWRGPREFVEEQIGDKIKENHV